MDAAAIERTIALVGAIVVGTAALWSLKLEWPKTGLDDHVAKIMLGLLALGCCIVILVATRVLHGIA
ncbi:MAG TPA: hypothetical protein VKT51_02970 [Candidatus Eremiobacteraceae bacterium]|nr:hypothetical protein [Candidatus Eremiobacteraceae bacterium]